MKTFSTNRLVLLVCLMPVILFFTAQADDKRQKPTINIGLSRPQGEQKTVTGPKAWAIGCSAIVMERNHAPLDTLATCQITEREIDSEKYLLDKWWGVNSKQDLLKTLSWLEKEGHRRSFDELVSKVAPLDEKRYERIAGLRADDPEALNELRVARQYGSQLGGKSILGWDYCRYIALCRWGYTTGLLGEQEAWDKIMPIARKLQKTFNSWEDLACNYLIGRQFWSNMQPDSDNTEDAAQRLLDMPSSPWNKYPWKMDLGLNKDANDANEIPKKTYI